MATTRPTDDETGAWQPTDAEIRAEMAYWQAEDARHAAAEAQIAEALRDQAEDAWDDGSHDEDAPY